MAYGYRKLLVIDRLARVPGLINRVASVPHNTMLNLAFRLKVPTVPGQPAALSIAIRLGTQTNGSSQCRCAGTGRVPSD